MTQTAAIKTLPLANLCVLIVEELPDELHMLTQYLGKAGARILTAASGNEALELAPLMHPDAVVMDVRLPAPDGFAVCQALLALPGCACTPIVFISGMTDLATKLAGFAAGGRDYLTKPFAADELVARVALHARLAQQLRLNAPNVGVPRWLTHCAQHLTANLNEPPSLAQLAQEAGCTVHRLQEAFKAKLHATPTAYVREARLKEAACQLRNTGKPIAAIGAHLGYPNPANFATAFKERFGTTPRAFRANGGSGSGKN